MCRDLTQLAVQPCSRAASDAWRAAAAVDLFEGGVENCDVRQP